MAKAPMDASSSKSLLGHQASLFDRDPLLGTTPSSATAGVEDTEVPDEAEPLMDDFSGLTALKQISVAMDSKSDSLGESEGLFSEEEDCNESTFILSAEATQLNAAGADGSVAYLLPLSVVLQDMCKLAAEWLGIPWPSILAETTSSHYEGK
ncbi:hypothetical protein AOLI_G00238330 [Acnodon oligacanthus]